MKKSYGSFRNSGAYTSPGTPEYANNNVGEIPKGWCSERVALPASNSRRHISAAALIPFNSGRALPSKWDDAERWITSPVSGYGSFKCSVAQPQRQPKSKSGPLGSPRLVYLSNYSPTMEGGSVKNLLGNSPLTTGVIVPNGLSIHYDPGIATKSNSLSSENNITRSTSVPGLSDLLGETSVPSSQDDRLDGTKEEERAVSRRDMATQMSPEGSTHSSSKGRLSFSILPSSSLGPYGNLAAKDEIRDVQIDKGTSTGRQSKKQGLRKTQDARNVGDSSSPWNAAEASKNIMLRREEAKITAWENLQKAKAEAAIRKLEVKITAWENLQKAKAEAAIQKLEMKLEKKRSASIDKIVNKLGTAQMKAEAMRNTLSDNHAHQTRRTTRLQNSCSIFMKMRSFRFCLLCHRN